MAIIGCVFAIGWLCALALFFGLFFGLNEPDLEHRGYTLSECTFISATIQPRYCCDVSCGGCDAAPASANSCATLQDQQENMSVPLCESSNGTCPHFAPQTCNNGYFCCSNACDTCTICTKRGCRFYPCNCHCTTSVNARACQIGCGKCFTTQVNVQVDGRNGTYVKDFGKSLGEAQVSLEDFPSTFPCYYNDQGEVILIYPTTPWFWALTVVFGIIPLACMCTLSGLHCRHRHRRQQQQPKADPHRLPESEIPIANPVVMETVSIL